jgi:hypothetical protein
MKGREMFRINQIAFCFAAFLASCALGYSGGNGTSSDPYQIRTSRDLIKLGGTPGDYDKHFILTQDIDLDPNLPGRRVFTQAVIAPGKGNSGFNGTPFRGVFDGDGYAVFNMTISYSEENNDYMGLFGDIRGSEQQNAIIKNLRLIKPRLKGVGNYSGCLAGHIEHVTVSDCHVEDGYMMTHEGDHLGILMGASFSAQIIRSSVSGLMNGGRNSIGGLIGISEFGPIDQCFSTVDVIQDNSNGNYIGGLVGNLRFGSVSNCYAWGSVHCGPESVEIGGLLGANQYATVTACYVVGSLEVGPNSRHVGGLIGGGNGHTSRSYWDTEASGVLRSQGGAGRTTLQMADSATFVGWGFEERWSIDDGMDYPRLAWEKQVGDIIRQENYPYGGGRGTTDEPFEIHDADQLNAIGQYPQDHDKHFVLMSDVTFDPVNRKPFNSIGTELTPFTGTFDGSGHSIANLYSSHTGVTGMFGYVAGRSSAVPSVKNLTLIKPILEDVGISSGCLVGTNRASLLENCRVLEGRATSIYDKAIGVLVGFNHEGVIKNCSASGYAEAVSAVGGLVGQSWSAEISDCFAVCRVKGQLALGGLVGNANKGVVARCFSGGAVEVEEGAYKIGGFIGSLDSSSVMNCYSTADVTLLGPPRTSDVFEGVGGLIGRAYRGKIENCYASGVVNESWGRSYVSGLIGAIRNDPEIANGYYLSGENQGWIQNDIGAALPAGQMVLPQSFSDWDFVDETANGTDDIWFMPEGHYPRLVWQGPLPMKIVLAPLEGLVATGNDGLILSVDEIERLHTGTTSFLDAPIWPVFPAALADDLDLSTLAVADGQVAVQSQFNMPMDSVVLLTRGLPTKSLVQLTGSAGEVLGESVVLDASDFEASEYTCLGRTVYGVVIHGTAAFCGIILSSQEAYLTGIDIVSVLGMVDWASVARLIEINAFEATGNDGEIISMDELSVEKYMLGTTSFALPAEWSMFPAEHADDFDLLTLANTENQTSFKTEFAQVVTDVYLIVRPYLGDNVGAIELLDDQGEVLGVAREFGPEVFTHLGVSSYGQEVQGLRISANGCFSGIRVRMKGNSPLVLDPVSISARAARTPTDQEEPSGNGGLIGGGR